MIRRRLKPKGSRIDWQSLAIAKPEPRDREKRRKKRQFAQQRKATRAATYERDGGRCVHCRRPLYLNPSDEGADWYNVANINEKRPRSLGGSAIDTANTNTLCAGCHTGSGRHVA